MAIVFRNLLNFVHIGFFLHMLLWEKDAEVKYR